MGYTRLKNSCEGSCSDRSGLEGATLNFIRESCENLRFNMEKEEKEKAEHIFLGTSRAEREIPYNMQMDIDRLCLENAIKRFLGSGTKQNAFDIYFCYLEMFVGDYEKTRRMIELLSEFEANGSSLLMKHRDHYSHSVYVFILGLALFESNAIYRAAYIKYYKLSDVHEAAHHFLRYWGLASLFHDIGYPFELPYEQVCSYFEVSGDKRSTRPFVSYQNMKQFVVLDENVKAALETIYPGNQLMTSDELFAHAIVEDLGEAYNIDEKNMINFLTDKPTRPDKYNFFMDHAYFSATVLLKKLFGEMKCELNAGHIDALTAILLHNSLFKFTISNKVPLKMELHPLAYMLMLCDELQCWDRTSYGRNTKAELYPMGIELSLSDNDIKATYLFDERESPKIECFVNEYNKWEKTSGENKGSTPVLKAFSKMYIKQNDGKSNFLKDIEKIVDLSGIILSVDTKLAAKNYSDDAFLSESNFINLYNFAVILNGQWRDFGWKEAHAKGIVEEERFLTDEENITKYSDAFKKLSLEYKLSNINQAKAFAKYLNVIGCFYTNKPVDLEMVEEFDEEELQIIGKLEHQRWLQEHYDMGWEYGTPDKKKKNRDLLRLHEDMIPGYTPPAEGVSEEKAQENYNRLDKAEQKKDTDPMKCMLSLLRMFDGLRIYRLN